jgi:hypothetical protein
MSRSSALKGGVQAVVVERAAELVDLSDLNRKPNDNSLHL